MARLPKVGGDINNWGSVLNEFLMTEHNDDGSLKENGSLASRQPLNTKLTEISLLQPVNGDFMQFKAGKWANRLPNQVKADLQLAKIDVGLDKVDNTSDLEKPVSSAAKAELDAKVVGPAYVRHFNRSNYFFVDQCDSGWTDFYANGSVGHVTDTFMTGTGAIKIVTPADLSSPAGMRKNLTTQDWTNKCVKMWIKADDWAKLSVTYLEISTSGTTYASFFRASLGPLMSYREQWSGQWIELVIPQSRFTVGAGTPSWATVGSLRVKAYGTTGNSGTIYIDEIAAVNNAKQPIISITFDDGHVSQFTNARPILDKYGYRATNYTIPNYIGVQNYMSQAQTDQLAATGWDVSGHHETNLHTMTTAQLHTEMKKVRAYLNAHGYKGGDHFAYPNGSDGTNNEGVLINTVVQQYFASGRTIISMGQPTGFMDRMRLPSAILHNTDTLAAVKGWVDTAIANNDWLVLCFHKIVPSPASSIDWSTSDFAALIDYIATKNVPVLPVSEALTAIQTMPQEAVVKDYVDDKLATFTPVGGTSINTPRWLRPYHNGLAAADAAPVAGRVVLYQLEIPKACTIDALVFVNGSVPSGNVTVGLYGPVTLTTDTCAGAALVAQSASTAVTATNAPQIVALAAPVAVAAGKYYLAIEHDNTTNRYLRLTNQSQVVGWMQYFDQTYGVLPNTCPAVTETGGAAHGITARCSA